MSWETEAWDQMRQQAGLALKPGGAARALCTARRTQQQRRETAMAVAVTLFLVGGFCASTWVQASAQEAENLQKWNEALVAEYAVTRSL